MAREGLADAGAAGVVVVRYMFHKKQGGTHCEFHTTTINNNNMRGYCYFNVFTINSFLTLSRTRHLPKAQCSLQGLYFAESGGT